jgi:hypothetical protein
MASADPEEVQRTALRMIERFGDKALDEVDLRVLVLLEAGEREALQMWVEIREVVRVISMHRSSTPN